MLKARTLIKEGWLDWDKRLGNINLDNNQIENLVYDYTKKDVDNKHLKRRASKMNFEKIVTRRYIEEQQKFNHVFKRGIRIRLLTNVSAPKAGQLPKDFNKTIIIVESISSGLMLDAGSGKEYANNEYRSIMIDNNSEIIDIFGGLNFRSIRLEEIEEVSLYDEFIYIEDKHNNKMVCSLSDNTIEYNNSLSNIKYNKEGIQLFKRNKQNNLSIPFIKFKLLKYNI